MTTILEDIQLATQAVTDNAQQYFESRTDLEAKVSRLLALGAVGGTANAISLTHAVPYLAYTPGMRVRCIVNAANTGPVTLNVDGLGPKAVKRQDGAALANRSLAAQSVAVFDYDGTSFRFTDTIPQTQRAFTLFPTVAQSIPNSVETSVTFGPPGAGLDPLGFYDGGNPTRLTIPAGISTVRISGVGALAPNNTGYRQMRILQNGGAIPAGGRVILDLPALANICAMQITGFPISVSPGDYFTMLLIQNSGGALNTDNMSTSFTAEY